MCACRATWGLKGPRVPDLPAPSCHNSHGAGANIFPWATTGLTSAPGSRENAAAVND